MKNPYFSIVIPVYNEEDVLPNLYERLVSSAQSLGKSYEIIFVNDGSSDGSLAYLQILHKKDPKHVRIVDLSANVGQYQAIVAGFAHVSGEYTIIMDADLQNYPEDMVRLLPAIEDGADYVGSFRETREDSFWRDIVSKTNNIVRRKITGINMTDHGCMLRAFHHDVVRGVVESAATSPFVTLEAYRFARNPKEIGVRHADRQEGDSKYSLRDLFNIFFDWLTHFSEVPLYLSLWVGLFVATISGCFGVWSLYDYVMTASEHSISSGLVSLGFMLGSFILIGLGLQGMYLARMYKATTKKAPYIVRKFYKTETS